ncbi:YALIA101S05e04742g1_1 [Yarrowia lipolytica]|jgi:hypothetical protein|nr:Hypothetical protein YALI2_E00099g [Yarrowia lipolytica]SEI34538.1 YALIA101S05e04742g1_1 [Yarrowia lipolytica]VBB79132.1 Hypothetical protein conserved in the Yarrowia clade [Yarrowia lipolytica]
MHPKTVPREMPPDEQSLALLQAAWAKLDPLNKGTIAATQMLAAVDAIEASFGMVPGKFISRRGRKVIADFADENPRKRVTLEKMVRLFEAFDKSVEMEGEQSVSGWMSQNEDYSDYYGDAQRVSEIQTPGPEVDVGASPPVSPKASSLHTEGFGMDREQHGFPDILGELPDILPELDHPSPTRTTQYAPFQTTSASSHVKYVPTNEGRSTSATTNYKPSTISPMTQRGSLTSPQRASRRGSTASSRPTTLNSTQTLGNESSRDGFSMSDRSFNRSTPLRPNRRSWAKSNDEAFFERMRKDDDDGDDDGDFSISMADGDTDSLMRINHKHMNELHQLRNYAAFCETQMEDSELRHVDLEASILAKTKECREHVSRTKAHQEGLEQVSQMITELTEILGRKGKRNSRTGSISSTPDSDVLEAYKNRLEVQLEALGKSGELQEAEIKRLTTEKIEQQQKVEALEAQIKSLTDSLTKVTDNVTTMKANKEREDFLDFEARLNNQDPSDFSSINEILEQQNLIINDLKEKLLEREQKEEPKDIKTETVAHVEQSTISTGLKNAFTIIIMVIAFHLISEIFFPSNLPEGVLWWMNAPAPIERVFGALDAWVARHDDFRMPM